jgi:hypothetical protein
MDNTLSRESLLREIQTSWNELLRYLNSVSEEQLTIPTDAAGWTAKDHVIHLAVWESAAHAMLEGKSKREFLNISPEVWEQDDDPINAVLQERYEEMSIAEVIWTLHENHERLMKKLNSMSEADFQLPYSHYQGQSSESRPIIDYVHWDTVNHYGQHLDWIRTIIENA